MKTWLITGCSAGLGRELAEAVARRGDRLIATARSTQSLQALGELAHGIVERKFAAFRAEVAAWRDISIATDFAPRA